MSVIRSKDNARVKHWSKLARDTRYRRAQGRALIEGPHLLAALLDAGLEPLALLATEGALGIEEVKELVARAGIDPVLLTPAIFRGVVEAENPPGVAAEVAIPAARPGSQRQDPDSRRQSAFLEGVQDPANVGAILRSAAALGVARVVLDHGCADPWSPKALRAGMGGHFNVSIHQVSVLEGELSKFRAQGETVCTLPAGGASLREAELPGVVGWVFGSEGSGVSPGLQQKCDLKVTIPTAPGAESLNVAAAAAICFYEIFSRPGGGS